MSDDVNALISEIKPPMWPETGDKLFIPGYGRHVAYLGLRPSFSVYATGYKYAADALVDRVLEKDFGADLQFYPIAFLYRHYLELRLKDLLIYGGKVVYDESKLKHKHDLMILWREVRKILEEVWPGTYSAETDALEKCIEEFCALDAESMCFRYPVDKKGQPSLPNLDRVDLINLKSVMERVGSFLDCSSDGLGEIWGNMPRESDFY